MASARAYNIVVRHMAGLGAGFFASYLSHAWAAPNVLSTGIVSGERIWAVTLATSLTPLARLDNAVLLVSDHLQALQNKNYKKVAKAIRRPLEAVMSGGWSSFARSIHVPDVVITGSS
jgi:hypothetical protein